MNRYLKFALNFSNSRKLGNIFPNVFFLFFISAMLGLTNNILALSKALPSEIHRIQKFGNADFPVVNIEIITTPSTCNQANGTASLSPETLTYRWAHNGQIGFEMSGLLAGDYQVEVIENGATTQTLTVHIDNENGINVYLASSSQPTCGTFDGVVNVGVEYGSGSYSFAWSDGFAANTSTRTQLSAGVYVVTVTDQSSGCTKTANINLPCTSPPTIDVVTSPSTCQQANGSASLSPENLQYQWLSDNFIGTDRNNLASGSYTVVVKQNGSIIDTVNVVIESENNLNLYLAQVNEPTCDNSDGSVTVAAENGSGTYGYAWSVAGATSQNTLTNIGSGNYFVTVTDGLFGCTKTLSFAVTCKTTTSEILPCNPTTTTEEIVLQDCSLKANYCIDINQNDINTYNIELDATVDPLMQPCAYDTSYTYAYFTVPGSGNIGPYNLTSWLVDGRVLSGSFIDINELVVLMNNLNPTGRWTLQQSSMTIVGGAARTNYGDMDIQQLGTNATTKLSLNSVITSTKLGFALEVGEHT
nr:hypothetical protein [Saprospiraceae bacterium]